MEKIYIVYHKSMWDGENYSDTPMGFKKEKDALSYFNKKVQNERADWANECVEETERSFSAWREGEYNDYHCEIYVSEMILH